jgi:hypothetical protein
MKKIVCLLYFLLTVSLAIASDSVELISKARKAMTQIVTVKSKGTTVTAGIDITNEEATIDYSNKISHGVDYKKSKVVSIIYCQGDTAYVYEPGINEWFQYPQEVGFGQNVFSKEIFFTSFPDDPQGAGFIVTFAGKEDVSGDECYLVQSNIFNRDLAKEYIKQHLEDFMPEKIADILRTDEQMLEGYLNVYVQQPQVTLWISNDDYKIKKYEARYQQITGPNESVSIKREVQYYGFNRPVSISIPDAAFSGEVVSLEDIGLNR